MSPLWREFSECADGIELQWSSDNTFVNCQFLYNTHAGIDAIRDSNNDNLFISCIFQGYPDGGDWVTATLPSPRVASILVYHAPTGSIVVTLGSEITT